MSSRTIVKSWISRITETWHLVLSWMHWRRRKAIRQRQEEEARDLRQEARLRQLLWETLLPQLRAEQRAQLLEALHPVAEAMKRLDQRILASQVQAVELDQGQRELLLEVLNSLQPTASQQLLPRLGSTPPPSFQHSVS